MKDFSEEEFIMFDEITNVLSKELQSLKENIVLYSGQTKKFYSNLNKNEILKWDSFISTSLDPTIPKRYKRNDSQALFVI